jgi:hypothetical protein
MSGLKLLNTLQMAERKLELCFDTSASSALSTSVIIITAKKNRSAELVEARLKLKDRR